MKYKQNVDYITQLVSKKKVFSVAILAPQTKSLGFERHSSYTQVVKTELMRLEMCLVAYHWKDQNCVIPTVVKLNQYALIVETKKVSHYTCIQRFPPSNPLGKGMGN